MRKIDVALIQNAIKDMCIEANHFYTAIRLGRLVEVWSGRFNG